MFPRELRYEVGRKYRHIGERLIEIGLPRERLVVAPNGQVTFQLYAPKATAVVMRSEGPAPFENQTLTKSEAGVWSVPSFTELAQAA